jgi:malonyl-CoA/methylmalonyl-CoA synthetase
MLLHRNLLANVKAVTEAWRWTEADRLLLALPLFHTHGLMVGLHGSLYTGASVDLRRRFVASEALEALREDASLTMFFGVPTMYGRLLEEARRTGVKPRRLRLWVSGSAPLSPRLFGDIEAEFGARILERYGMTETIMNTTNPYDGERRPGTVGFPYPGQEARVVDVRTRRVLPRGETGEIAPRLRGLLAPAGGHGGVLRRGGLVPHRGPGRARRGRLPANHRPGARAHHQRGRQRVPA